MAIQQHGRNTKTAVLGDCLAKQPRLGCSKRASGRRELRTAGPLVILPASVALACSASKRRNRQRGAVRAARATARATSNTGYSPCGVALGRALLSEHSNFNTEWEAPVE